MWRFILLNLYEYRENIDINLDRKEVFPVRSNKINDDMGFVYIAEQTTMDNNQVSNIDVTNKNGVFFVSFDTVLHTFNEMNRNQRMYEASNIQECLMQDKIRALLADNAFYGEMDHPTNEYKDKPLSPERIQAIWMPNRSHKIMSPRIVRDELQARIETASGTDAGVGFAKEIIQGLKPAFSCRAIASMKLVNGKPTVSVRRLITYDWVLYPSHARAHAISGPRPVLKQFKAFTESVSDSVSSFVQKKSKDVLIPLKEILETVGRNDVNTQAIMESFELPLDSLCGFDQSRTHAIIKDDNNVIYANISPETKRRVDSYFESFNL